jgi:hypothetical protein
MDTLDLLPKGSWTQTAQAWFSTLEGWWLIVVVVAAWLGLVAFLLFLLTHVDYRLGPKHVKVTILGIPERRVRLDNIRNIHTRKPRFAERWHNMLFPTLDRILVIEKRRGLIKRLLITPEQRYVFRAELDRAIRVHLGLPPVPSAGDVTTFERMQAHSAQAATPRADAAAGPPWKEPSPPGRSHDAGPAEGRSGA